MLRFLLIAACASLAAVSPVGAVKPATTVPATQLADELSPNFGDGLKDQAAAWA
jgi:hypothetical protein